MSNQSNHHAELETADGWISIKDLQSGNSWLGNRLSKRLQKRTIEIFSLTKQKLWHTSKILIKLGDAISSLFVSKAYPFDVFGKRNKNTGNIIPHSMPQITTSGRLKINDVLLLPHNKQQYQICLYVCPVQFAILSNEVIGCRHLQTGTHYESRWQTWDMAQMIHTQTLFIR